MGYSYGGIIYIREWNSRKSRTCGEIISKNECQKGRLKNTKLKGVTIINVRSKE